MDDMTRAIMNCSNSASLVPDLAGLVLAAGSSSRLGRPKQVLVYRSRKMVERVVMQAADFCGAGVVVVTGANRAEVVEALAGSPAETIHNPDWNEGISTSVRAGMDHVDPECRGVMILLCDQPHIGRDDLAALVDAWVSKPERIAAADYAGSYGVPAIFPARYREGLIALEGDQGGKRVISGAQQVSAVKMPHAEFDIDTPDDLDNLGE